MDTGEGLTLPLKILVIKPSSLGDVIHALPFLKAVKDSFPHAQIDWVISRNLRGLLEGNPLIHELIDFDKDSWSKFKNLHKTISEISLLKKILKKKHYDIVVDLQGLLRTGLISFFTAAGLKVGFSDAREGSRYFYDTKIPSGKAVHAVDKCLEIARALGAEVKKAEFPLHVDAGAKKKIREALGNMHDYVVIAPSARWNTKRWPAENFAALLRKIHIPVVIAGSKGDKEIASEIVKRFSSTGKNNVIDFCGETTLKELIALISGAKAVVSNDSGPMHIAAALNTPVVALFGPTDPEKTGPYGWQKNRNMKVIRAHVPCNPCRKRTCRDMTCMKHIHTDEVLKALKGYL
ncbi:MAG: lipopolysaccharide heptosyltransferase I [Nitrospiraceae bacterium]|nr:MAG: lipopolysaccharide heptosyltransferase I [Nitrospiraceae bacterium]